jgi:hypothetical protein
VTSTVLGVLTRVQYTTSTSTVTVTGTSSGTTINAGDTNVEAGNDNIGANSIQAMDKFTISVPMTVSTIYVYHGVTGRGNWHIGIYSDGGANYPTSLIVDSGEVSANQGTGWHAYSIPSTHLAAGTYWIAGLTDSTSTAGWLKRGATGSAVVYKAQTYGALPSTFPSSGGTYYIGPDSSYVQGVQT